MTKEQALQHFQLHDYWSSYSWQDDAAEIAAEAIEKQIPKQAKGTTLRCPACDTPPIRTVEKLGNPKGHSVIYCWNCGQAIKWSQE